MVYVKNLTGLPSEKNIEKIINILPGGCFIERNSDLKSNQAPYSKDKKTYSADMMQQKATLTMFTSTTCKFISLLRAASAIAWALAVLVFSVKEWMVLNFHGSKFLQSLGKHPS